MGRAHCAVVMVRARKPVPAAASAR